MNCAQSHLARADAELQKMIDSVYVEYWKECKVKGKRNTVDAALDYFESWLPGEQFTLTYYAWTDEPDQLTYRPRKNITVEIKRVF
jgi:hypothetical protein